MFEALGIAPADERVYTALVGTPELSPEDLARELGLTAEQVGASLGRLAGRQMVHPADDGSGRFSPAPPDVSIAALVNERQRELDKVLLGVPDLLTRYHQAVARNDPSSRIEVVTGSVGMRARFAEHMAAAQSEVAIFDRDNNNQMMPGYAEEIDDEAPALRRGVACRVVYDLASVAERDRLNAIRRLAELGEQARVVPRLPMKLVIFDRKMALLPLAHATNATWSVAVLAVHASWLLDGLIDLFEDYWERGSALSAALSGGPHDLLSGTERQTLAMLCTGMKDEAIARQLGISPRTLNRRIIRLMTVLGVSSRFQAGIQAARLGLV